MPTAIKETGSGTNSSANTYATVAEVETYADNSLYFDAWNDAVANDKTRAVIGATALLDRWLWDRWLGSPTATTQPLCWPRNGCLNRQGEVIADDEIPQILVNAVAQIANLLLAENLEEDQEVTLSALSVGSINLTFDKKDRPPVVRKISGAELACVLDVIGPFGKAAR